MSSKEKTSPFGPNVLYDRVIDVTLYSMEDTEEEELSIIAADGEGTKTSSVRIVAGPGPFGRTYSYKTIKDLHHGLRPDGVSLLQQGDRIKIIDSGKFYHVESISADAVTRYERRSIRIECPSIGMKPDISFSVSLIPGQVCYKMTLQIKNLNIGTADIRKWNRMEIEAGYQGGMRTVYNCPIHSSYTESPNPDGITTFVGLTVGAVENPLKSQTIWINFPKSFTLRDLIEDVGADLCYPSATVENQLIDEINNIQVSQELPTTAQCGNGYELLCWLQRTINDLASVYRPQDPPKILVQLSSGTLTVFSTNTVNNVEDSFEAAIDLSAVYNVAFNGSRCTLEAPWNPAVQPGGLFWMPPTYYKAGTGLPNITEESIFRGVFNLDHPEYGYSNRYRVLQMQIVFSTVGADNRMSIVAVPEQYVDPEQVRSNDAFTQEEIESFMKEKGGQTAVINVKGAKDVEAQKKAISTKESAFEAMYNIPIISMTTVAWLTVHVNGDIHSDGYTGNSFSTVAEIFYGRDKQGGSFGSLKELGCDPADPTKVVYPAATWPLITVATHQKREVKNDLKYGPVTMNNPEFINNNINVLVPAFTDWRQLQPMADVFYYAWHAYTMYKGVADQWLDQWSWLYKYLTGKEIDDGSI